MLQLVRAIYPQACLISEIVSADEGSYLIRASIQTEGIAIANAFAVNRDLEVAQDKALERLFKILGIEPLQSQVESGDRPILLTDDVAPIKATEPVNTRPASDLAPIQATEPDIAPIEITRAEREPRSIPDITPIKTMAAQVEPNTAISALSTPNSDSSVVTSPTDVSKLVADKQVAPRSVPSARHYELINLTDVEIQRLGWTKKQGRDYLDLKYGEKVRSDLTEAQLEDFWRYLQSL